MPRPTDGARFQFGPIHSQVVIAFVLEIIRRGIWNLFMLVTTTYLLCTILFIFVGGGFHPLQKHDPVSTKPNHKR